MESLFTGYILCHVVSDKAWPEVFTPLFYGQWSTIDVFMSSDMEEQILRISVRHTSNM